MDTLTRLGQNERDEQSIPALWQAVVEGRASAEELEALEVQAQDDEEIASLLAAFAPMTDEQEDALTAHLLDNVRETRAPMKRRARGAHWAKRSVVVLAAVAAAVMLFVQQPTALPNYQLEAARGDLAFRGEAVDDVPKHHVDSALSIVLRPERRVDGEVEVATFLRVEGRTIDWPMPAEISGRRAVRVEGNVGTLLGENRGPMAVVFVVAPAGGLPNAEQVVDGGAEGWQQLTYELEVIDD